MGEEERLRLLERAREGDLEAFGRLLASYSSYLARVVERRLPRRLRAKVDVSDVVQSTYREAIEGFDRLELRDAASVKRLLTVVADRRLSRTLDRFAAKKREAAREVPFQGADSSAGDGSPRDRARCAPAGYVPAKGPGPATRAGARDRDSRLRERIEELPDPYRSVMRLELEGRTSPEIAEALGAPESTVRSWRVEARKRLRSSLSP